MDFTVKIYKHLLNALQNAGYSFQTFAEFLEKPEKKVIVLRHDVDAKKGHSLRFARIQHELGIRGTYFFRMVPQSYDPDVIRKVFEMGHEVGYHYEDMDFASSRFKVQGSRLVEEKLIDEAIKIFEENLEKLRRLVPVKTICMHGSPRSPFDNKAVWKKYDYRDYGIIGEPYFDIDFSEVFYLTDTGRMWDGERVSVRDKVVSGDLERGRLGERERGREGEGEQEHAPRTSHLAPRTPHPAPRTSYHTTHQIIAAANRNELPKKIMFTFHPQRWTDKPVEWLWELGFQTLKNQVKKIVIRRQSGK